MVKHFNEWSFFSTSCKENMFYSFFLDRHLQQLDDRNSTYILLFRFFITKLISSSLKRNKSFCTFFNSSNKSLMQNIKFISKLQRYIFYIERINLFFHSKKYIYYLIDLYSYGSSIYLQYFFYNCTIWLKISLLYNFKAPNFFCSICTEYKI